MASRLITRGRGKIFSRVAERLRTVDTLGQEVVRQIRLGPEGVEAQFLNQGEIDESGTFRPWVQSQRALGLRKGRKRTGGLTLVDTGDYLRAWTGRGPGAFSDIRPRRKGLEIRVGVDPTRFPQVNVFQRKRRASRRHAVPRPVSLNPGTIQRIGRLVLRHLGGER